MGALVERGPSEGTLMKGHNESKPLVGRFGWRVEVVSIGGQGLC